MPLEARWTSRQTSEIIGQPPLGISRRSPSGSRWSGSALHAPRPCGQGLGTPYITNLGPPPADHGRLGPQQAHAGQAVLAGCDRQGHVQQALARIVHRPRASQRRQRPRYRPVKPGLANGLDQQHTPGLGHHGLTAAFDVYTRVGPDTFTHLEK